MLKILVSDDVILFIEHVVSFCAWAMDITGGGGGGGGVFKSSKYCCI